MGVSIYTPTGISHSTSVDFGKRLISQTVHIVQYDDTLPILAVSLYNNGQSYVLPDSTDVRIRFGKPDRTFVYTKALGCDSTRSIVYFEITQQMTVISGDYYPVIELNDNDKIANSSAIHIIIDRNPIQHDYIESVIEYKEISKYRNEAEEFATNAKESETNAKTSADSAKVSETNAKTSADSAKVSETNAKTSADRIEEIAKASESYAHGGTGTREGEDTDNARYYMEQAKAVSNVDVATTDKAGIVKPDGNTITVDEDGTLHGANTYELPVATTEILGGVKPDGTTITVDEDGTLHGQSKVDEMTGATADADGTSGTVPAPMAGQENRVLKGNGAWEALAYDSELSAESENAPQTKVVDAKTKKIEENIAQLSNPNLLINPDFRINQRGGKIVESDKNYYSDESCGTLVSTTTSAYTATKISNGNYSISIDSTTYYVKAEDVLDGYCESLKYTVDRWQNYNGKVEVLNKGIKSDSTVYQLIENSDNLLGKTVTLSAKIDGVVKSGTCTLPSQYNGDTVDLVLNVEFDNVNIRIFVENNNKRIQGCNIESKNRNTFVVEWVKLELGSIATPFVPPDPASELLKCQRYGFECGVDDAAQGYPLTVLAAEQNVAFGLLPIPVNMRSTPSITKQTNTLYCFGTFNTGFRNDVRIHLRMMGFSNNAIQLIATIDDNLFVAGNVYTVYFNMPPKSLFFDAEIY